MWKRAEDEESRKEPAPDTSQETRAEQAAPAGKRPRERATIGPGISIQGEVRGDEDLLIQGRVDGTLELGEQSVTVGSQGHVQADIKARVIEVHGRVKGDLKAKERVIVRASAKVTGGIGAPRVQLEDGCRYKGAIEMDGVPQASRAGEAPKGSEVKPVQKASGESAQSPRVAAGT